MITAHAAGPVPVVRMARALLLSIGNALPGFGEAARDEAFASVDNFVAAPSPSRYVAAMRRIAELRRISRRSNVAATMAERAHARAITALASVPALDATAQATLAGLPIDAATGQRLFALAELLRAHQELAARVRRADAERRPMNDRIRAKATVTTTDAKPTRHGR